MTYFIRHVDHEDPEVAEDLTDLHKLTFLDGTHLPLVEGRFWGDWWIAYERGDPVAFLGTCPSTQGKRVRYIMRVGVLPEHRGHGLQVRLMRAAERHARRAGCNMVVSDTTKNPASANSFIACGYKTYLPKEPWSFEAAVYWRKSLGD